MKPLEESSDISVNVSETSNSEDNIKPDTCVISAKIILFVKKQKNLK
ncbi:Uncharacterised protein [Segatella copri]|nr:Uncharacterised protein [Segatella copri]